MSVLFVGNSFTHSNDLPDVVEEVADANGVSIDVEMIAPGGWFLDQHVLSTETMDAVRSGDFDVVVVQEQSMAPSHAMTFQDRTLPAARQLAGTARGAGSRVVLFQTWGHVSGNQVVGHDSYDSMQAALISGYANLEVELGADVAPVGERWRDSREALPQVVLYSPDGVHPSAAGTYLAAVTIADTILDVPVTSFPGAGIDAETAGQLGRVATG